MAKSPAISCRRTSTKNSSASGRSFATVDLPEEKVRAIAATKMDKRHEHLNALLEPR
jgi:hypothetical protein